MHVEGVTLWWRWADLLERELAEKDFLLYGEQMDGFWSFSPPSSPIL